MDIIITTRMGQELLSILQEYAECLAVQANRHTTEKSYDKFQYIKEYAEYVLSCAVYWDIDWTDADTPVCTIAFKDYDGIWRNFRG